MKIYLYTIGTVSLILVGRLGMYRISAKYVILFNQTCLNEELHPTYTNIYIRYIYIYICDKPVDGGWFFHFSIVQIHLFFVNWILLWFFHILLILVKYYSIMFIIILFWLSSDWAIGLVYFVPALLIYILLCSLRLFLYLISFLLFPCTSV